MKLRTKLLINFTVLFFVLFNVFGFILIKVIFYTSLDNEIESSVYEYNIIYSNLKTGENMSRQFYNVEDIITLKNNTYLSNSNSELIDLMVEDEERNILYSSVTEEIELPDRLYNGVHDDFSNYMIMEQADGHQLLINKKISFDDESYYLIYRNNLERLYKERMHYFFLLFVFDFIGGIISIAVIYYFTKTITQPLQNLVSNIGEVRQKNYGIELKESSDIAEIRMLADSFNAMSQEISSHMRTLEQANQEKQRFIDSLTHEIRTPLTSIIGYSSLCLSKKELSGAAVSQAFDNIYKNGKRIEKLTENLIKLITLDKTPVKHTIISIQKLVEDIQSNYRTRLEQEQVEFRISGHDRKVVSDEDLLGMLFSNFIDNGIKAVSDSKEKKIEVILEQEQVLICDSGKGLAQEDLEKIFEPFYMADKSRKRTFEGFGLGLAICKSIMEILSIEFDIKSELGKGTTIYLKFHGGAYEEK